MQIAILALLFTTHMGSPSDISSLAKWIDVLGRDKTKMWDGQKSLVKDFRQALDYFDTVLEGHILTALSKYCAPDVKDIEEFAIRCKKLPAETLINGIKDLAKSLANALSLLKNATSRMKIYAYSCNMVSYSAILTTQYAEGIAVGYSDLYPFLQSGFKIQTRSIMLWNPCACKRI